MDAHRCVVTKKYINHIHKEKFNIRHTCHANFSAPSPMLNKPSAIEVMVISFTLQVTGPLGDLTRHGVGNHAGDPERFRVTQGRKPAESC